MYFILLCILLKHNIFIIFKNLIYFLKFRIFECSLVLYILFQKPKNKKKKENLKLVIKFIQLMTFRLLYLFTVCYTVIHNDDVFFLKMNLEAKTVNISLRKILKFELLSDPKNEENLAWYDQSLLWYDLTLCLRSCSNNV